MPASGNTGGAYDVDQLMEDNNTITIANGSNGAQTITDYSTTNTKFIRNKLTELRAIQADGESNTEARRNLLSADYFFIGNPSRTTIYQKSGAAAVNINQSAGGAIDHILVPGSAPGNAASALHLGSSQTGDHNIEIYTYLEGANLVNPPEQIVDGETYTYSVYVKKGATGQYRYVSFTTYTQSDPMTDQIGVIFDLDEAEFVEHTQLSTTPPTDDYKAVKVTDDGWYRLAFTGPAPDGVGAVASAQNSGATRIGLRIGDAIETTPSDSDFTRLVYNDSGNAANTPADGVLFAGLQVEKGDEVSPFQNWTNTPPTMNTNDPYSLTITGGSISISNNITFLTPETLGVVNEPLGHVTGTRTISGSFTCYLDGSLMGSSDLFSDIVKEREVTNSFNLSFRIGAGGTDAKPQLRFNLPKCHLEIPTHNIEDIVSLETNFHALPSDYNAADEVSVSYLAD